MARRFLSIKNFGKYQHYKNRNPPWIRLYYAILDDPSFTALDEVQQSRLMKLFLIASKQNNEILDDPYYLAKMMRVVEPVDITPLIKAGFLLASCKRRASIPLAKSSLISDSSDSSDNSYQIVQPALAQRATQGKRAIHDDDKPTEKHFSLGKRLGIDVGPEWGKFKNYCLAHDKRYANFEAAFRNWIANSVGYREKHHAVR